ncbi:PA14 domain-containing protein [Paenibacillus sp. y28]|uniref:PA14 domain-containing protein n=1 Tax=Paenibacillus sp. y28 TaxID=3129110 RepID=UPI00301A3643
MAMISLILALTAGLFDSSSSFLNQSAKLQTPYANWKDQEIPFGIHSYYYAPWRSYMDTWDSRRYLEVMGVVFNVGPSEAPATAQVLGEAGIRSARLEIGWNNISYDDPTRLIDQQSKNATTMLQALKNNGIRPILLLNANSGGPAPSKATSVTLTKAAAAGDKVIYVSDVSAIKPFYTGLQGQDSKLMYPVITAVNASTGECVLSAPLKKALPAGALSLVTLKYQPFSGAVYASGAANPAAQETVNGWMTYVGAVTSFAKNALGTEGAADAGFDLEVWNEYSFGSEFLDINNYYETKFTFSTPLTYTNHGQTQTGVEVILPMTVDYVNDPNNKLPGVQVISGFSNQRPWDSGSSIWKGQSGFSRHYYTGYSSSSVISNETTSFKANTTYDGIGQLEQAQYVPYHISAFPERWFYAYQTEYVVRDIQPFPGPYPDHHRYANPGNGQTAQVWMTETNFNRNLFATELMNKTTVSASNAKLMNVMHWIGTKSTLRNYVFYAHKGIHTINLYSVKGGDLAYGILPDAFFTELKNSNYQLTDKVRSQIGPQLKAVANVTKLMKTGVPIDHPRPIKVDSLYEYVPRIVYEGDDTPAHPTGYNQEDAAILPFQLDADKYAIGYYVVTRNLVKSYTDTKDPLDTKRYEMPPQVYEVTLSNIRGTGAKVTAYDPVTDSEQEVNVVKRTATTLTVRMEMVDYPRFLLVQESAKGPLIQNTSLTPSASGATFTFTPSVSGKAEISWGAYPVRTGSTFKEQAYSDEKFQTLISERNVDLIHFDSTTSYLPSRKGSWRWTGTIVPKYSETYTFHIDTIDCNTQLYVNDTLVVKACDYASNMSGSIALQAGQSYTLRVDFTTPYARSQYVSVYWASDSQSRQLVSSDPAGANLISLDVCQNKSVSVSLPQFTTGDGVKVLLTTSNGVSAPFPQWDYDVKGALWPSN